MRECQCESSVKCECLVLVPGVLLNLTASPGSSPTLACKLQSQQRSLEVVWARRQEQHHRLLNSVSEPLLLIDNHLYKVGGDHLWVDIIILSCE